MSDYLWVEKYRPRAIRDCILTADLKETFLNFLKQKEIPNLLLSGTAGTGKTTVARALCEELGADYIIINGSDEGRHIDTLRNFIETFYNNCRFIFTCNYKNKIIPALHSRCTVIDFKIANGQKVKTATAFMLRLIKLLEEEKIGYDKKVLAELVQKFYPDFRRTINELQRYSVRGKIDSGILFSLSEANNKELIAMLKDKKFNDMRKWVVQNLDKDPSTLFTGLYDVLYKYLEPKSIPQAVLIIAGYQYKAAFVADQEINMVARLSEIMANFKFK